MASNMLSAFNEYFEMVPASSDALKQEVYKLRYQVYCIETGFEQPENYPGGIETDAHDEHSIHYLIRHRKTGLYVATTRLVLPDVKGLPIESHCVIDNVEAIKEVRRHELAEISRFCVSKECKRRKSEQGTLTGIGSESEVIFTEDERRTFPHITIALIACLIKMSAEQRICYWYGALEPALLRFFLNILGVYPTHIGPLTDYHGKRQPCVIKVSDVLDGVAQKNPDLWGMLTNEGRYLRSSSRECL